MPSEFQMAYNVSLSYTKWLRKHGDFVSGFALNDFHRNMQNREYEESFWAFFSDRKCVSINECVAYELAYESLTQIAS